MVGACHQPLQIPKPFLNNDKPMQENRGSSPRIFAHESPDLDNNRLVVESPSESPLIEDVFVCCTSFLSNVFSSRLVSTLAITTHPPRCCEDHGITQGLLLTSSRMAKSQKKPGGLPPHKSGVRV